MIFLFAKKVSDDRFFTGNSHDRRRNSYVGSKCCGISAQAFLARKWISKGSIVDSKQFY